MDDPAPLVSPTAKAWKSRIRSYALMTAVLSVVVLGAILGAYKIADDTPKWVYWAIGLAAMRLVDAAFALAVAAAAATFPVAMSRATRRDGAASTILWRKIGLLCGSILLGAFTLECASAVILRRQGAESVMPAGGPVKRWTEMLVAGNMPSRAPVDLPTTFPATSDRPTVVVVGESSAEGVPFNRWLSIGSVVAWGLGREIPGRSFLHQTVAESGHTLERQLWSLADVRRRPDVLIVYAGHNEFSARIPVSRDRAYYTESI